MKVTDSKALVCLVSVGCCPLIQKRIPDPTYRIYVAEIFLLNYGGDLAMHSRVNYESSLPEGTYGLV